MNKVNAAVSEWYAWSKAHGEDIEVPDAIRARPTEVLHVTYNPAAAGKPEPLFWSEVLPISTNNIETTLRLMKHSRDDLLNLSLKLDRRAFRWKPDKEPRTIGNCLKHIALVEWWYITRLNIDLAEDFPSNTFELLRHTRQLADRSLSGLSKEKRTKIFQPKKDSSPICDLWTARKVLRRFVDHERLHTKYIRRLSELYRQSNQNAL